MPEEKNKALKDAVVTGTLEVGARESEVETAARLERSRTHQQHQIWRERLIIIGVTAGVALLLNFSLVVIALPGSSPEAKEVARQILPSITTGLLGYFVGRRGGSS